MDRGRILVVGAGLMGAQIGCEYALGGYSVTLVARDVKRVRERVEAALELVRAHGLESTESVQRARRLVTVARPDAGVDPSTELVVESLPEDLDTKRAVLSDIVKAVPGAIIASNTSSIPITDLGEAIGASARTIGTHYWNPPLLMPLVEVVVGRATAPAVVSEVTRVLEALGKEPVLVRRDVPGFIWNRLQQAILREALWLVQNGVATPEAIDTVVRSGIARRSRYTGPFETIALGGVDTWQKVASNLFPHLSSATEASDLRRWLPPPTDALDAARARRDDGLARELTAERLARVSAEPSSLAFGPNLALAAHGGSLTSSSEQAVRPLNDGVRRTGYRYHSTNGWRDGCVQPLGCYLWSDASDRQRPDWAQIEWREPRTFNEIVLRMPVLILLSEPQRTIGRLTLEFWDDRAGEWRVIQTVNGEPNPVVDWTAPSAADGSEVRSLGFDAITTDKVRVVVEQGTSDGWSYLEEIEVYARTKATAPFLLRYDSGPDATTVLQPGDECRVVVAVTDAEGLAVVDQVVTFAALAGGGSVAGGEVRTDRAGRAEAVVATGPEVGDSTFSATIDSATVTFRVGTLPRETALAMALSWLEESARTLERGSKVVAFDGTALYTPDGVGSYDGFWVRDFQYMIEGYPAGLPVEDVRRGFEYLISRQRADGAMPNKVRKDGTPVYCPGPGCDGVFGPQPPPDNPSFMVKIAHCYVGLTRDLSLFEEYASQLARGMEFVPRSPHTRLVYIPPEKTSSPYGFTDAIAKTGDQLFDSILYFEAATHLAQLFAEIGDEAAAGRWAGEAADVKRDLQTLRDSESGMFFAASVDCRQIDIWGSAYAAYVGAIPADQQRGVAGYLKANYRGIVRRGQVRHTAPGEYWQRTIVPNRDVYQDGAYWALPSGWVATVIGTIDRGLAQQLLLELVKDFQANGINEAINPDVGYVAIPKYVASATNPIPVLRALARGEERVRPDG